MPTAGNTPNSQRLMEIRGLKKYFPIQGGLLLKEVSHVRALDGVDLYLRPREIVGLVGESGCGKTTLGRLVCMLEPPTAGSIEFEGSDILNMEPREQRELRKRIQMIIQDPFGSLNPRWTVKDIIGEPLKVFSRLTKKEYIERILELMALVGLGREHLNRFPHEFSGGQRQRISIARSIILNPDLVVADEPVSALDVSIQAQILNLLIELQDRFSLSYLFISHDLRVIEFLSDRIAVMYLGKVIETAPNQELQKSPLHPYTQSLLAAIPNPDPRVQQDEAILRGEVPSPINIPTGCRFHPRCSFKMKDCTEKEPSLLEVAPDHWVACHLHVS